MPVCAGIGTIVDGSVLDDAILYAVNQGAKVIQLSLGVQQTSARNRD